MSCNDLWRSSGHCSWWGGNQRRHGGLLRHRLLGCFRLLHTCLGLRVRGNRGRVVRGLWGVVLVSIGACSLVGVVWRAAAHPREPALAARTIQSLGAPRRGLSGSEDRGCGHGYRGRSPHVMQQGRALGGGVATRAAPRRLGQRGLQSLCIGEGLCRWLRLEGVVSGAATASLSYLEPTQPLPLAQCTDSFPPCIPRCSVACPALPGCLAAACSRGLLLAACSAPLAACLRFR